MNVHAKTFITILLPGALLGSLLLGSSFTGSPKPKKALKGTINISGTRFLFPLIEKWGEEFKKEHPGVDFVVKQGVPGIDIEASAAPVKAQDPAKGSYTVVSRFALVPIANEKNPALVQLKEKGLSKDDLEKIYFKGAAQKENFSYAGIQVPIRVYARGACASATFSDRFGKQIKDLSNLDTKIGDDQLLLQNVINDSLGVAYNNLGFVYDLKTRKQKQGIRVVPIDINGNGKVDKEEDFYESLDQLISTLEATQNDLPPTGNLTLIYKDDRPEVKAFVDWILAKGQSYTHALGFLNKP